MKKIITIIACLTAAAAAFTSCNCSGNKEASKEQTAESAEKSDKQDNDMTIKLSELPEEPIFDIVTNMGTIKVKLYSKTPKHRDNFAKLALEHFYDGILFHRVINGFMIQAGIRQRILPQERSIGSSKTRRCGKPQKSVFRITVLYSTGRDGLPAS